MIKKYFVKKKILSQYIAKCKIFVGSLDNNFFFFFFLFLGWIFLPLCDKKLGITHTNDFCEKKNDKVTTFSGPKKEEEIAIFLE
jgi:hypothetical protein